jgi:peptide/nickel transport system permease protein
MRYIVRKLGFYLSALWIAITLNFIIPRMMPGDPADTLFASFQGRMNPQQLVALKASLGFTSGNLAQQYVTYLWNIAHLNLGLSYSHFPVPVSTVIADDLPWTLLLVGLSVFISAIIGTLLGIIAAWKHGSRFDSFLPPILLFLLSFPAFWISLFFVYIFGLNLHWFPTAHAYAIDQDISLNWPFIGSVLYHAFLPASVVVIITLGGWVLGMRNNMISTLAEDFITMAQAKGLSEKRVMLMYAARNAILPQVTSFALTLAFIVSGQVLVESVFSYPGVGYDLVQAATLNDYPLLQGLLLIIVVAVLVANFVTDLIYVRLDPRVRQEA